jgi:hypothetical protein
MQENFLNCPYNITYIKKIKKKMRIPCEDCLTYAICIRKNIIECSLLYEQHLSVNKHKPDFNDVLLDIYARVLGHTSWAVFCMSKTVCIYSLAIEKRPPRISPYELKQGKDY